MHYQSELKNKKIKKQVRHLLLCWCLMELIIRNTQVSIVLKEEAFSLALDVISMLITFTLL